MSKLPCTSPNCRDGPTDEELENSFGAPPNKWELGRAAWLCMHTGAANIRGDGSEFSAWLRALLSLYPCQECKQDFERILQHTPIPHTGDRASFSVWVCEFHNAVNRSLGAPSFPCDCVELLTRFALPPPLPIQSPPI
eukprot:Gregarina_sp_Pseudo_9__653@NODE_1414_length_1621_cov_11_022124_g1313_i0_p4_GENE_NODE_1414_length_1621_cov_11_022124_g1313_i0NODE_1414_length_1621_cov_11_022124_g1313_i0_p4_ORF_typecomplete_len138_score21_28Evr1_Alr/PF04777_13/1_1e17Herpes_heli_pri/PF05774_11/0_16_NODE_1414_length_1621_cov_11_022124_g1313_i0100513